MSKYTTQLRWIIEQEQGKVPSSKTTRYTIDTYKKLGLSDYPIFNENYRYILNDKILDHFFFREIGFETCAQFSWYMRRTMNEIMPYYNKLYEVESLIDDPMNDSDHSWKENWDYDKEDSGTISDDRTGNNINSGENHDRNVFQDTPMSLIDNSESPTISNLDYATTVTYDDATSTEENTRNENELRTLDTNEHHIGYREHDEKGRRISQVDLFDKFREKFLNIDMEIISKLENLFMGLW